ncbi:MAG TPA: CoA-acylating methylmalonate-semialdehyde dehydrogenase [Solirubrobacteraceae bacterium]|jgi:malonate-semialdehyde dehydrogenase (acetylating)/methylmalonate-semialdehyde dehydrogenase|nr:CoA-acylating methylmalonate-semialdehyde dehydrogenase [Solirubrobacteraceae bacterium]
MTTETQVRVLQNYVGGRWTAPSSERRLDVVNPATQEVLARVPLSGREDLEQAVSAARAAFPAWRSRSTIERARWLFSLREALVGEREELARLVVCEMGKTLADARAEVGRMIEMVEAATAVPTTMQGRVLENVASGVDCETIRQPVGVCAAIVPFNFPAMVPFWFLPFAIATGNTFVLKPSEQVPLTQNRVFEIIDRLELPAGVVNLVNGDKEVAQAILESPGIDAVSFVGSAPVAAHVYATAAAHGKRVQALGGAKNHMVVMPDAVIDRAVDGILASAFGAAGQRCMAGSVVVTVGEAHERLLGPLADAARALKVGDGLDPEVAVGPVISVAARERIEGAIEAAAAEGATVAVDGRGAGELRAEGAFVGPTILTGVTPEMDVVGREVFGPVLAIIHAENLTEAIEIVNASPFGNGTSIFTESGAAVRRYRHDVEAGMVGVNIGVAAPVAFFPFSGWKASFFGDVHAHGTDAVDFYTRKKTVTSRFFTEQAQEKLFGEH